jgi:hypothetical protein
MPRIAAVPARRAAVANVALWIVQVLLAALFLYAGVSKLVMPAEALTAQSAMPAAFLRAIGVLEALGALGLLLPGLLHRREELTSLAAGGLVLIMCGALGATMSVPATASMAFAPAAAGILAAVVAVGRARLRNTNDDRAQDEVIGDTMEAVRSAA